MISYDKLIKNVKILLVDSDMDYLSDISSYLKIEGYNIDIATSNDEALNKMSDKKYQILITSFDMSDEELISKIRKENKNIVIILKIDSSETKNIESLIKKLDVQYCYEKSEGINKLNIILISAIKILNQQLELELVNYRDKTIGNLMPGIASQIRSNLLSISAGTEYINMCIKNIEKTNDNKETIEELDKFSNNNKKYMEKIDIMLTAIINLSNIDNNDDIIKDIDSIKIIELILKNNLNIKGVTLNTRVIFKTDTYLIGHINDAIFVICDLIKKIIDKSNQGDIIELILSEDESNWYYKIKSENVSKIDNKDNFLIENIVDTIQNVALFNQKDVIGLIIKKN